jgi:hypothetical protein
LINNIFFKLVEETLGCSITYYKFPFFAGMTNLRRLCNSYVFFTAIFCQAICYKRR